MKEDKINSYKDLIIWKKSMDLVSAVYKLIEKYPDHETYGLAAHTKKPLFQFLQILPREKVGVFKKILIVF